MSGKVYVEKELNSRLRMVNTSGAAVVAGEFVILGKISGVALESIPAGGVGAFHVEEGLVLQVGQADFGTGATFNTANADVFFGTTDKNFYNATGANRVLVGQVIEPTVSGVMRFAKNYNAT